MPLLLSGVVYASSFLVLLSCTALCSVKYIAVWGGDGSAVACSDDDDDDDDGRRVWPVLPRRGEWLPAASTAAAALSLLRTAKGGRIPEPTGAETAFYSTSSSSSRHFLVLPSSISKVFFLVPR